ncbi:MAG: enoyl-CoA hydratase/isomerase family protein [Actinomycetia bacterium]|nr:enoyl-CoA hydratase/isomerase family protein [Actinomycetes bacterium]MCH9801202.1 enoyl-CoA hydratase/isomerase family protein [Actinomycetes bacterium]
MSPDMQPTEGAEKVICDISDGIAVIRFNRPEARNALDPESMQLLTEHLESTAKNAEVRAVVLTGTGDTFSAGADLKAALSGESGGFAANGPEAMGQLLTQIADHPKPTIARVQGNVYGGGNGLVAACDLSVAADDVRFAFSEVRLGLTPAVISVVCLPKMRPADAAELFLTGEKVPAQRVAAAGLINKVAAREELDTAVEAWTEQLRLGGPEALAGTKELIRRVPTMARADAFAYTAELSGGFFRSEEAREGMTALFQRRKPAWAESAGAEQE